MTTDNNSIVSDTFEEILKEKTDTKKKTKRSSKTKHDDSVELDYSDLSNVIADVVSTEMKDVKENISFLFGSINNYAKEFTIMKSDIDKLNKRLDKKKEENNANINENDEQIILLSDRYNKLNDEVNVVSSSLDQMTLEIYELSNRIDVLFSGVNGSDIVSRVGALEKSLFNKLHRTSK